MYTTQTKETNETFDNIDDFTLTISNQLLNLITDYKILTYYTKVTNLFKGANWEHYKYYSHCYNKLSIAQ